MKRQILSSRLTVPKPRRNYIVRSSLFALLAEMETKRLTVIQGGAGSGKTTLLSAYITRHAPHARWISLDDECNDSALFWSYVAEALLGENAASGYSLPSFAHTGAPQARSEALKILINLIGGTQERILVLDDFHLITNEVLLGDFAYFIGNLPPVLHIVLLTRSAPALYLAGYEMQGELLYLDERALALNAGESLAFLRQTLGLSAPEEMLLQLARAAGGWIGGLQLLAAAKRETSGGQAFDACSPSGLLEEYITAEIFSLLTPEAQQFLILSALPSYFSKAVCTRLLPGLPFETLLASLMQQNLMIQCADEALGLYRFHSLFREYLLGRFARFAGAEQKRILHLLAEIFYELGDTEESLHHLFALKDYELAMKRILLLPAGPVQYHYMSLVPPAAAMANFDFAFQKFFYHYYIYDFTVCTELYHLAMKRQETDARYAAFRGANFLYNSQIFLSDGDLSHMQDDIPGLHPLTRALILTKNAAFLFYQDCYTAALSAINESIRYEAQCPGTYIHYFNLTLKMQICEELGLFERVLEAMAQAERMIGANELLRALHAPTFSITAAGLYMKQMRLEDARQALESCRAAAESRGGQLLYSYTYNRIEYLFLTGEADESARLLTAFLSEHTPDLIMMAPLLRLLFLAGAMKADLQRQFAKAFEEKPEKGRPISACLLYVRILAARGEQAQALAALEYALKAARKQQSYLKIAEATLLRLSLALRTASDTRHQADLYREAIYYACENRIRQPFFLEAETIRLAQERVGALLSGQLAPQERAFQKDILSACRIAEPSLLSPRELEILQAMMQGLTNAEIADKLFISLPTVKTHISSIFRKLEVKGRVAALQKAQVLGIL